LPASYLFWNQKQLRVLENQLSLISFYSQNHPKIYFKNLKINNDLFFFNTGIVVDANGDIFFTNAVMLKEFHWAKKNLKIGNLNNPDIVNRLKELNVQKEIEKIKSIIKKSFPPKILKSNQALDSLLNNFVDSIRNRVFNEKRIDIKIGYQCNNHCLFCVQGDKREKCAFRDKDEIKKDLISAKKTCDSVVFTGGEPTIHSYFLDLVSLAKKLNFQIIQIQTNSRMFSYKKFCQETIKAGANEFSPALHGHTAKLHDFLTTAPGSFNQTIQGIKNLKELKQKVITNTVINKFNYRYLPKIAKLLVSLNVDQFQFAFVHMVGSAWKNRNFIVPQKSRIMPFVKRGLDIGIKAGLKVMTEAIPYCFMRGYEQYTAERIIPEAMVVENNFKIKDYKEYRINRGKIKGPKCKNCLYFPICEGPWREYPEIFGWEEFEPIIKKA
jgi:MoaA/NifB/PqqE/SkfB family radical SAM enzyme